MSTRAFGRVCSRVVVVVVACACVCLATLGAARPQAAQPRPTKAAHTVSSTGHHYRCGQSRRLRPGALRRMLVVGASYTAGVGASHPHDGYAWLLARELGGTPRVNGVGGTGFVNAGVRHQGTFRQRLAHLRTRPTPDLVLLQGGRDDARTPARREIAAARSTICFVRHRFERAQVAVLGPIPAHFPVDSAVRGIDGDLRSACRAEHALYIDPIRQQWMTPELTRRFAGPVPHHPNDAGYRYIAARAAAALRAAFGGAHT